MKNLTKKIPYKKPLVIGMGGGNDIVSASLILSYLKEQGVKADLAGLSSPGAWHNYNDKGEKPVNIVTENMHRFRPSKNPVNISYIDPKLPKLLKQNNLEANVYNVSLRYGTENLIKGLNELIDKENYDGVIAVDIGGDVLARGREHSTILSPLMDFSILYVINQLKIPSTLLEFGLQTDGELRPDSCNYILEDLEKNNAILSTFEINKNDASVNRFRSIYNEIAKTRHGHTAHMTLKTLEETEDINTNYKFMVRVLDKKWFHEFPITLESKYFGKVFAIDPKKMLEKTNLAFPFKDSFELYVKMKSKIDTKAEMDMLYAKPNGSVVWLGLLCPQMKPDQRKEILNHGLNQLEIHADVGLFWKKDEQYLDKENRKTEYVNDFMIISKSEEQLENVKNKLEEILKK